MNDEKSGKRRPTHGHDARRTRVKSRDLTAEVETSFLDYAMSVIVLRALPDARDGLKPVHRRILYAMHDVGLLPGRPHKKSATVVGEVLGKYHPHGDSAVYDALVRLAQDFALGHPLVDGQGNFGSIDGDAAAAYRYTEARLAPIALELLEEIDRDTVDFSENFDARHKEPVVLPARLPNLLVNGSEGIAVGMATRIPPHNLGEIAAAIAVLCDDPGASDEAVLRPIRGPDFPTGGLLLDGEGVATFQRTGRGKMTLRARFHVEQDRRGRPAIVVTEIPYGVAKSSILSQIADLVRGSRGERKRDDDAWGDWIADLRDESDREGIRMVVTLRRDTNPERVIQRLCAKTSLQVTYGGQLLALVNGAPRLLSVRSALEIFIAHRLEVLVRSARHDLAQARRRMHLIEGLLTAIASIEQVVEIIRRSRRRDTAASKLRKTFRLTAEQAEAILSLRLAQLTALDVSQLREEFEEKRRFIAETEAFLADEHAQRRRVREETEALAERFGRPRRTRIMKPAAADAFERRAATEPLELRLLGDGRISVAPATTSGARRDRESVLIRVATDSDALLVALTDRARAYAVLPGELNAGETVAGLDRDERVIALVRPDDLEKGDVLLFSRMGYVKRTDGAQIATPRRGGLGFASVPADDRIIAAVVIGDGEQQVLVSTAGGKAIRFSLADVPAQGRAARGVRAIRLIDGDTVAGAGPLGEDVAVVTARGFAQRIAADEFPLQRRAGQGVRLTRLTERTGVVVHAAPVGPASDVVLAAGRRVARFDANRFPVTRRGAAPADLGLEVPDGVSFAATIRATAAPAVP